MFEFVPEDFRRFALMMEVAEDKQQFMGWYMTQESAEAGAKKLLNTYPMNSFHVCIRVSTVSANVDITPWIEHVPQKTQP